MPRPAADRLLTQRVSDQSTAINNERMNVVHQSIRLCRTNHLTLRCGRGARRVASMMKEWMDENVYDLPNVACKTKAAGSV